MTENAKKKIISRQEAADMLAFFLKAFPTMRSVD